jgi:hypothetical protein
MRRAARIQGFWWLALAGLLAIMVAAGCGGSSSDTTSIAKVKFVKRGNALCTKAEREISEALGRASERFTRGGKSLSLSGQEKMVSEILAPEIGAMAEKLGAEGLPKGQEDEASQFLEELEQAVASSESDPAASLAEDPIAKVGTKAASLGLVSCVHI